MQIEEKKEVHVNFWVPEKLATELKINAVKSGKSMKKVVIEALEYYLRSDSKV